MHLAYSAINTNSNADRPSATQQDHVDNELMLRYLAFQAACNKYSREITAIQKYIPGWVPKFR